MPGYYATDLTLVGATSNGESATTTVEATAYSAGTLITAPDTDHFIQGTASLTGLSSKTANTGSSVMWNRGSTLNITNGSVLTLWTLWATPSALDVFAATNGAGTQIIVGTSTTAVSTYRVDGSDTNPYGGWKNYVVDLRNTPTGPNTTGGGTTNQYYGATYRQIAAFKTAVPLAIDAIRYGRMTLSATQGTSTSVDNAVPLNSTAANFPQMSYYNDYNLSGTPQLSATNIGLAVDGGYHRFGQLTLSNGVYSAKGVLSIGTTAASVYFNDANRNINFEDSYLTYSDFNRIEIRNVSSTVIWNSINFAFISRPSAVSSGNAPATPRGNFEMHDNAIVKIDGCSFTDMGTFIFKAGGSGSYTNSSTFRRCNQITVAGMPMDNCLFTNGTDLTGNVLVTSVTDMNALVGCEFLLTGTSANKSIKISGTYSTNPLSPTEFTFNGHSFTNTGSGNSQYAVDFTGTGYINIVPTNGCNITQSMVTSSGGGTATVVTSPLVFTVKNIPSGAEVRIRQGSYTLQYYSSAQTSLGYVTYNYYYGGDEPIRVSAIKPGYIIEPIDTILVNEDSNVTLVTVPDPSYVS